MDHPSKKKPSSSKTNGKRGKKEEYSARIPRVRQLFGIFLNNLNDRNPKKKLPTNAEIGRMLQPDDLGRTIAFVASMPPHVCVNEILISPTWNRLFV